MDRLAGEHELALGLGQHALADQVAGGDAGRAPDVIVEAVDASSRACRRRMRAAAPCGSAPRPACAAPRRWRRWARAQPDPRRRARGWPRAAPPRPRSAPAARAWRCGSRRAPGTRSSCSSAARFDSRSRSASPSGTTGSAASAFRRASASPRRSPIASATSSVKLITQPSVTTGRKRKPCAMVAGTRIAHGASKAIGGGLERHLAAAALDQQDLEQVAMAVRADGPVVDRRARRDRLDVNEVERLIVRRIAVEMEQRKRGGGHAKS